jgi:hypothetical protein
MIPDKLLINLKIISKIQKNGRIARSCDGIISLENDVFYQFIKRFVTSDSRKQAIFEINSVVNECVDILHYILNSKYMNKNFNQNDEYIKNCENISLILSEMEAARCGIENLKFTYQNDPNIVSQIDIIILKINTTLKDIYNKLYYFETFLPIPTQPKLIRSDNLSNTESLSYQYHTFGNQNQNHTFGNQNHTSKKDNQLDDHTIDKTFNKDETDHTSKKDESDNETDDNVDE